MLRLFRTWSRRQGAAALMTVGVLAVGIGAVLVAGIGVGLCVFGAALIGVSVLAGWNA